MILLARISRITEKFAFLPQLFSRLVIGYVFVQSGWGKLHHLEKVIDFFQSIGIPAPQIQAPFVAVLELTCGALVLVGFATRLVAMPLIGIMVVALITAKKEEIIDIKSLFSAYEFLYVTLLMWIVTKGAGPVSVDSMLEISASGGKRKK